MKILRNIGIALLVIIVLAAIAIALLLRGSRAELTVDQVSGTDPTLVEPESEWFPTINVAEPVGWAEGEVPEAAEGLQVTRFAEGLDHPRILYRLPNGDILVTLTNSPPRDVGGIEGFIMLDQAIKVRCFLVFLVSGVVAFPRCETKDAHTPLELA